MMSTRQAGDINQSLINDEKTLNVDAPVKSKLKLLQLIVFQVKVMLLSNVLSRHQKINKSTSSVGR